MTSSAIRRLYLDFFRSRDHMIHDSSPLIPYGDPSLMFTSAGMVPFKPYFLGLKKDIARAASCQKCFRTTDIERVGTTLRHMTFFEMLGNFSFGDYFKQDAIAWAWEFLTKEMQLDPKRLHPTVFKDDDEAFVLWQKLGLPNAPARLGSDSNFWNMGPTGPCGPCSEIYFDRGREHSCGKPGCTVGCDCDRYLEIWNLVFTQFDRRGDGSLKPLPRKNIDTGMGLERLAFVAQGKPSPFDTDLFRPIVEKASLLLNAEPRRSPQTEQALRIIADHSRAVVMLMAEGVIPSNVERGYVLRRLIRRAVRYGQLLGHARPFAHRLIPAVLEIYAQAYPELKDGSSQVASTLKGEEEKFLETLVTGEAELGKLLAKHPKTLPGERAFWLYETFGFPLELTKEIAAQRGVFVDEESFKTASEKASGIARAAWKGSGERVAKARFSKLGNIQVLFTGYESLEEKAQVVARSFNGNKGVLVLDKTPCYPEGGGQVGDEGLIMTADGRELLARVTDTQKEGTLILHMVDLIQPNKIEPGGTVLVKVDLTRRSCVVPHHTATHLLNEALRRILGAHVRQAGSYVGPDKLRFDFTNPKAIDPEQLNRIEAMVNEEIKKGEPVIPRVNSIDKVKEFGAVTLLGEDYGQRPRFVLIGAQGWENPKERFSLELCGGTHVRNTTEIGSFKVIKEASVAAGVRRIEALAGQAVADYDRVKNQEREQTAVQLRGRQKSLLEELHALGGKANPSASSADEAALRLREKELKEMIARLKAKKLASCQSGRKIIEVGGIRLYAQRFEDADAKQLRPLADKIKAEIGLGLVFLAACPTKGKLSFILAATPDLASKGLSVEKIAKAFAAGAGGSAGGRANFAQGAVADADWDKIIFALCAALEKNVMLKL